MKFLHCSDIHLGKTFNGSDSRYKDYFYAFTRIVNLAIEKKVDFVIIAGDLFQSGNIAPTILLDTIKILERLKENGIPVIAIEGNHDLFRNRKDESWILFLSRTGYLKLLRPIWLPEKNKMIFEPFDEKRGWGGFIQIGGLSIYGIGYWGSSTPGMLQKTLEALPSKADIGIFHGGVWDDGFINIGRVSSQDIAPLGKIFRYVALGHGHRRYKVPPEGNFAFAHNPGAVEIVHPEEASREHHQAGWVCLVDMPVSNVMQGDHKPQAHSSVNTPDTPPAVVGTQSLEPPCFTVEYIEIPRRPFLNIRVLLEGVSQNMREVKSAFRKALEEIRADMTLSVSPVLLIKVEGVVNFSPHEVNPAELEPIAQELFNPSYLEIANRTSKKGDQDQMSRGNRDIDQIYEETILELIGENPRYRKHSRDILNLVYQIKKEITQEETPAEDLVDLICRERMRMEES